ncbi:PREDICTED: epsin-2 isoform X3 [Chaetura pelagica]|uniref:epsin-2 isoform X3 n=1 Tax=Chaetura pelagica TaxID=8897 RepID=UPI0005234A1C|nr:PREDICTED: epsin-2 isoform X3 [Chaetura pelagica]XP_051488316.1 epsin-2 isoform X2 [Apus apus]
MTTSSIRRQMKNIVNNYSEAEIKVREATSNDPWGPSSSLMTEIADLTYNVVAFSEIMSMIWKRLNDHGKNWRHVYKALTLLDYLIKTGSERVAQQCKENIFAIQTLKDFQYIDRDGKDQGINVREKSKQLVSLLKDDERLKTERAQALKTKERMAQVATGVGSNQITFGRGSSQPNLSTSYSEQEYGKSGGSPASYHGSTSPRVSSELEQARPQTSGEEELQLQLALAMSREVAEQEERLRRGDDLRLQMALEESRRDTIKIPKKKEHTTLLDLMDALPSSAPAPQKTEPWGPPAVANQTDPWGGSTAAATASDPWQSFGAKPAASVDPWAAPAPAGSTTQTLSKNVDPWAPAQPSSTAAKSSVDPWGPAPANKPLSASAESGSTLPSQHSGTTSPDLFDSQHSNVSSGKQSAARKTPESFLGPNAALVNLDSLVSKPPQPVTSLNPFLAPGAATAPTPINPFQVNQPQPLTLNQMRASPVMGTSPSFSAVPPMSMEPIPLSSMAPVPVGMAPIPAMGTVASITRMGQGLNVSIAGSMTQPLHSTGIPPSASQSTNTTNPFLL